MMSLANTQSIHGYFSNAPRDIGVARIGHFGFFRPRFEEPLWRNVLLPELS